MPAALESESFRDLLEHPDHHFKDAAFTMLTRKSGNGRSVRTDRYRCAEWVNGDKGVELYDHETDPHEYTNLANDPAHADVVAQLRTLLHAHLPATMPAVLSPSPD